jgi:acetyl-CoA carboxylase carboxyl transferase subunit alpha
MSRVAGRSRKPSSAREPEILEPGDRANRTAWDRVRLARHTDRPHTLDYINELMTDFIELHGDRTFSDDHALIGGLANFAGRTVMVLGHQKGRDTRENIFRNFGMARPEGYRKAERLMRHAEKFGMPVITFIDTPGAEPGIGSEERGQSTAIAESLLTMAGLRTTIVAVVIGEGGSGGALAIGVADRVLMLENAIYSVASPEASATILWKDSAKAADAARSMRITALDLYGFGMIDEIIPEEYPAHERPREVIAATGSAIRRHLGDLNAQVQQDNGLDELVQHRYEKFRRIGAWAES